MTQLEFYKSFQFVIELLAAEGIFSFRLTRRSHFPLRMIVGASVVFVLSYFFPIAVHEAFYLSFMFFVIFAYTVFFAKFLFRETWLKIIFCCLAGYTVQHLAYQIYNLALTIMGVNKNNPMGAYGDQAVGIFPNAFVAIIYFYVYIVVYFFSWFIFGKRIRDSEKLQIKSGFIFFFVVLILIIDVILNAVIVYNVAADGNKLYLIIAGVYNILCCVVVLILQFEVSLRYKLEETLTTVSFLRHQEKEHYKMSKETIELINLKCHDLKHQIRSIGSRSSINDESVKEITELISIYDTTVRTGNDALDIILSEKNLHCAKNNIRFSCIADGKRLDFMKEEDIYSLFGNLIDNAIEAVQSLEDGKRIIGLRIKAVGTMLSVNLHNYYEKELTFDDGIPQTTKSEKEYHGYGLKSVRYVCEKYGGDLSINADNKVFTVNILFSLAREGNI